MRVRAEAVRPPSAVRRGYVGGGGGGDRALAAARRVA